MIDTNKYKIKLESEKKLLEEEMKGIARKNPAKPDDWEAVETDLNPDIADDDEVADELENFDENASLLAKFEPRYNDIKAALDKIKKGTYGICEVGGEEIPEERLEANPAAKTCIEHSKK